jgi:hypothetical protein
MNRMLALLPLATAAVALATPPAGSSAGAQKWYEKAVKKVEASFSPAEAKPGQTVTFSVTVELNDGYHTYPTVQTDKMALSMVNTFKFPKPGEVIFVGEVQDPKDTKKKAEPEIGILELLYCEGKVTFTRKAVVSPKAKPGEASVKLDSFKLSVCDKDNCFPPKDVPIGAKLKVLDAPAVEVEKQYAAEVAKALEGK